jgi:hypothetical protein
VESGVFFGVEFGVIFGVDIKLDIAQQYKIDTQNKPAIKISLLGIYCMNHMIWSSSKYNFKVTLIADF